MKKVTVLLVSLLTISFTSAQAAEYPVMKNDNLGFIAEGVGHTVKEMKIMNGLRGDIIKPGQKLLWISGEDLNRARQWLAFQAQFFSDHAEVFEYYRNLAKDIDDGNISYDIRGNNSIHFSQVFEYAERWTREGGNRNPELVTTN